jgi:hypothetical protein
VNGGSPELVDFQLNVRGPTPIGDRDIRRDPFTGIKALMLAVLDNGIEGYLSPVAGLRAEAECWIAAPSQRSPFSFFVVCETLGLEPGAVRSALRRWRTTDVSVTEPSGRRRPNVSRAGRIVAPKSA